MKKITELKEILNWLPTQASRIALLAAISATYVSGDLSTFLARVSGLKTEAEISLLQGCIVLSTLLIGALVMILDLLVYIRRKATQNQPRERRPLSLVRTQRTKTQAWFKKPSKVR